jgi:hypothetical protein
LSSTFSQLTPFNPCLAVFFRSFLKRDHFIFVVALLALETKGALVTWRKAVFRQEPPAQRIDIS